MKDDRGWGEMKAQFFYWELVGLLDWHPWEIRLALGWFGKVLKSMW